MYIHILGYDDEWGYIMSSFEYTVMYMRFVLFQQCAIHWGPISHHRLIREFLYSSCSIAVAYINTILVCCSCLNLHRLCVLCAVCHKLRIKRWLHELVTIILFEHTILIMIWGTRQVYTFNNANAFTGGAQEKYHSGDCMHIYEYKMHYLFICLYICIMVCVCKLPSQWCC